MRLTITTPFEVLVDVSGVRRVRARDASGAFAVLPGHVALVTALVTSVVSWRPEGEHERHAAVRGGVMSMSGGAWVRIATPEAILGDDLPALEREVVAQMSARARAAEAAQKASKQLEQALVRQAVRALQGRRPLGELELPGDGSAAREEA